MGWLLSPLDRLSASLKNVNFSFDGLEKNSWKLLKKISIGQVLGFVNVAAYDPMAINSATTWFLVAEPTLWLLTSLAWRRERMFCLSRHSLWQLVSCIHGSGADYFFYSIANWDSPVDAIHFTCSARAICAEKVVKLEDCLGREIAVELLDSDSGRLTMRRLRHFFRSSWNKLASRYGMKLAVIFFEKAVAPLWSKMNPTEFATVSFKT